ncbi:hypothetical protein C8R45DRAFT_1178799 [Mycena sanguinolenta]|nr:hypothetical protein C8R45DRAFT_1178799 [Mycena sanguinolenta]
MQLASVLHPLSRSPRPRHHGHRSQRSPKDVPAAVPSTLQSAPSPPSSSPPRPTRRCLPSSHLRSFCYRGGFSAFAWAQRRPARPPHRACGVDGAQLGLEHREAEEWQKWRLGLDSGSSPPFDSAWIFCRGKRYTQETLPQIPPTVVVLRPATTPLSRSRTTDVHPEKASPASLQLLKSAYRNGHISASAIASKNIDALIKELDADFGFSTNMDADSEDNEIGLGFDAYSGQGLDASPSLSRSFCGYDDPAGRAVHDSANIHRSAGRARLVLSPNRCAARTHILQVSLLVRRRRESTSTSTLATARRVELAEREVGLQKVTRGWASGVEAPAHCGEMTRRSPSPRSTHAPHPCTCPRSVRFLRSLSSGDIGVRAERRWSKLGGRGAEMKIRGIDGRHPLPLVDDDAGGFSYLLARRCTLCVSAPADSYFGGCSCTRGAPPPPLQPQYRACPVFSSLPDGLACVSSPRARPRSVLQHVVAASWASCAPIGPDMAWRPSDAEGGAARPSRPFLSLVPSAPPTLRTRPPLVFGRVRASAAPITSPRSVASENHGPQRRPDPDPNARNGFRAAVASSFPLDFRCLARQLEVPRSDALGRSVGAIVVAGGSRASL